MMNKRVGKKNGDSPISSGIDFVDDCITSNIAAP